MKYKKYILFCFDYAVTEGGLDDIQASFGSIDEAISWMLANTIANEDVIFHWDREYVVDRDTWEIVWEREELEQI